MEEKQISGQEGLAIIQQMINTAKKEQKDNGMGWIIWGWLLFLASVFTYINIKNPVALDLVLLEPVWCVYAGGVVIPGNPIQFFSPEG